MILLSCCVTLFLYEVTLKSLAVLLPTLKDQFETYTWVIGTMISLLTSVRDLTGPIVGILASNINNRVLGMLGGIVIGVSTVCASFGYSVYVLSLLLSVINGISFALLLVPGYALLAQYFDTHYSLAIGIVYASASLGLMAAPPVAQLLLDTYGWRGTLLIIGGINCHLILSGSLLRHQQQVDSSITATESLQNTYSPLSHTSDDCEAFGWQSNSLKSSTFDRINAFMKFSGLDLFANLSFLATSVISTSMTALFTGWIVYFIPHCLAKGLTPFEAAFLATASGFSNLIGHVIYVPLLSNNLISLRGGLYFSGIVATVALLADRYTSTVTTVFISNMMLLLAIGIEYPLCDVYMKSIVEPNSLAKAYGWRMGLSGLVRIIPGFVLGWIYDHTGNYDAGFTFLGAIQAVGVLAIAADHMRLKIAGETIS
ncbi:monocarboxylate transporter 12-like [Amphiura filiformis]|uniref:monocarboxylate transporter 12-like n=1 Tax=Amphiura filiformis TaxID=82378 RepID=UPI003B20FE56